MGAQPGVKEGSPKPVNGAGVPIFCSQMEDTQGGDQISLSSLKWALRAKPYFPPSPKTGPQEQGLTLYFLQIGAEGRACPGPPPLGNLWVPSPPAPAPTP